MKELQNDTYYSDLKEEYIDSLNLCKQAAELYFANVLFGHDLSRIIYASPTITLRRRTEIESSKVSDSSAIQIQDLNLPYGSLFIKPQITDDDRAGAVSAAHILVGVDEYDVKTRAIAIKYTATLDLFFSNFEDARKAQSILWQESRPQGPAWIALWMAWNEHRIGIPCNITIDNITMDDYDETNWLAKARIFRIQVSMTIRTYNVYMPEAKGCSLPVRFVYFRESLAQMRFTLTQDVSLEWSTKKFGTDLAELDTVYFDDFTHYIDGYFDPDMDISTDIDPVMTETSAVIAIETTDPSTISYALITLNNITKKISSSDFVLQESGKYGVSATFDGLTPSSEYKVAIVAFSNKGTAKTYVVNCKTKADENDKSPTADKINAENQNLTEYGYDDKKSEYAGLEGLTL